MSKFDDNIKTLIREVLTQDMGIQNSQIRDQVWELIKGRIEQRINECVTGYLADEKIDAGIEKAINKEVVARLKSEKWPFKNELDARMKAAAGRVHFDVSIKGSHDGQ